jgi:hypothetical protein
MLTIALLGCGFLVSPRRAYGFFPTQITIGPSPGTGSTDTWPVTLCSSGGETRGANAAMRATAACISLGKFDIASDWRVWTESFERTLIWTPVATQTSTTSLSWPKIFSAVMPIRSPAGCFRIQPARPKTVSISFVNWIASSSWNTFSVYSIPLNGFRAAISSSVWTRDRGVFMALNLASAAASLCVESAKRCSASDKRDTASAACCLALDISRSYESASFFAPLANSIAFSEDLTALPDASDASFAEASALFESTCARLAACAAASAESLTCPNLLSVSPRICSSWARRAVSDRDERNSKIPSPATPATTNKSPRYAMGITRLFSFAGSTSFPLRRRYQRLSAMVASGASRATPIPTKMLAFMSQPNQSELSASSDWRTVSTAEELETKRNKEVRWALIILALLGVLTVCEVVYICLRVKV